MKTLVLGLGNPILSDDAIGIAVARQIQMALPPKSAVEVREVSVGGLTLMESMIDYERVILIDALKHAEGEPGTLHRLTLDELRVMSATHNSTCAHDTSLITALDLAERMGLSVPEEIVIYAIHVEKTTDFGEEMTPRVAQAVPKATQAVLAELGL